MGQNKDAIKLTNRTALALRRSAKRIEKISLIFALMLTCVMCACTIWLGIENLWTVPVMILVTAALDVIIIAYSRSYYLMLLSQAICTEASAREMRERSGEKRRREQALSDLAGIKSDIAQGSVQRLAGSGMRQMHADEDDVEDEDLSAPQETAQRMPVPHQLSSSAKTAPQATTVVRPAAKAAPRPVRVYQEENEEQDEPEDSPRRRRRKPTLQVIHGDQAK